MAQQLDNLLILPANSGLTRLIGNTDYLKITAGISGSPIGDNGASTGAFSALTASSSLAVTGSASITGDLTVEGVINSSGQTDSVTADAMIDLSHGNANVASATAAGLAANMWPSNATNCGGTPGLDVAEFKIAGTPGVTNARVEMANAVAQTGASITGNLTVTAVAAAGDKFILPGCAGDVTLTAVVGAAGANQFSVGANTDVQATNLTAGINAVAGFNATDGGGGSTNLTIDACTLVNLGSGMNGRIPEVVKAGGGTLAVTIPAVFAGGTGLSEGMFIEISNAVSTENDGLYEIVGISAKNIDVAGGSNGVSHNAPWCQTVFVAEADTSAKVRALNLASIAFSNGTLTDLFGASVALGSVCNTYVGTQALAATSVPAMVRDTYWTVSGADSLQAAYDINPLVQLADSTGDLLIKTDDSGTRAEFLIKDETGAQLILGTNAAGIAIGSGSNQKIDLDGHISSGLTFDGVGAKTITQAGQDLSITTTGGGAAAADMYLNSSQDFTITSGTGGGWTATTGNIPLLASDGDITATSTLGKIELVAKDTSKFQLAANDGAAKAIDIVAANAGGGAGNVTITADDQLAMQWKATSAWHLNGNANGNTDLTISATNSNVGAAAKADISLEAKTDATLKCTDGTASVLSQDGAANVGAGASSNYTVDGVGTALTIQSIDGTNAGGSNQVIINSVGTGDDAFLMDLTKGAFQIDAKSGDAKLRMLANAATDHLLTVSSANSGTGAGQLSLTAAADGGSETNGGLMIMNDGNNKGSDVFVSILAADSGGAHATQVHLEALGATGLVKSKASTVRLNAAEQVQLREGLFTNNTGGQINAGTVVAFNGNQQLGFANAQGFAGRIPVGVVTSGAANGAATKIQKFAGSTSYVGVQEAFSRGYYTVVNNGNVANGDSVTVGGQSALVAGSEWAIGADATATASAIAAAINTQAANQVEARGVGDKVLMRKLRQGGAAKSCAVAVAAAGAITVASANMQGVGGDKLTNTGAIPAAGSVLYLTSSTDGTGWGGFGEVAITAPSATGDTVVRCGITASAANTIDAGGDANAQQLSPIVWMPQFVANHP